MRRQFAATLTELIESNPRLVLVLAGIGRYQFRLAFERYPDRCFDLGINEQAALGVAGGLAAGGMIPVVYGIAPFIVERAYEQLKLDLGLPGRPALIATVGASYEYSMEGPTHHCPADVSLVYNIPGFAIYVPGHSEEVDDLLHEWIKSPDLTYLRLSERSNMEPHAGFHSQLTFEKYVLAVGPILDTVTRAAEGLPVSVAYTNRVRPGWEFPPAADTLTVEPYFPVLGGYGMYREFIRGYGTPEELDRLVRLDTESIRKRIQEML